jgi:hypothetical protein
MFSKYNYRCINNNQQFLVTDVLEKGSLFLHGMLFLSVALSLQQKQETPQAMTIIKTTDTQPTINNNFKLI